MSTEYVSLFQIVPKMPVHSVDAGLRPMFWFRAPLALFSVLLTVCPPYAWDMRAAYVIGTRHKEDYQLFVPRELAPDLAALTSQVMRQREDKGS